jgi:hypothetical protein
MLRERLGSATDSIGFVNSSYPCGMCVIVHCCMFLCSSIVVHVAHEIVNIIQRVSVSTHEES